MQEAVNAIVALMILANFLLLGTGSLRAAIRIVAIQGLALGLLPLLVHEKGLTLRLAIIAVLVILLKGIIIPRVLMKGLRELNTGRGITYYVGPVASLLIGILVMGSSLWWGYLLPLPDQPGYRLAIPMVFFTIISGLFLIVTRRQALMQIIGYLVLENGIYAFGVFFAQSESMLIEIGILLDVFVGVFIMGVMVFHISREFDSIEAGQLSTLKDWFRERRKSTETESPS
ncbi:hydrogenase [candidate division GN15 bacterium]|uniref:Hydrogenase n=1 Tax=candidate division GN15 bacterium TaxID=2072418 RepID=A0A855X380_9BACT|nr:MAG: hydrogenase [candidate division GN15 bacterium]